MHICYFAIFICELDQTMLPGNSPLSGTMLVAVTAIFQEVAVFTLRVK